MDYQEAKKEAESEEPTSKDLKARDKMVEVREGLLYQRNLLWAPKGMVQQILESKHDTKIAGHMGQDKTIKLI